MNKLSKLVVIATLVAVSGCSMWKHVRQGESPVVETELYSIQVPAGWTYHTRNVQDVVVISRDGPRIQSITSRVIPYGERFVTTDRNADTLSEGLLPTEIAEFTLAGRQSQLGVENMETLALEPASFAGRDGFRVEYRYRTLQQLQYRGIMYGAATEAGVHFIMYEAPAIHFFERDLATFERIVDSAAARGD